MKIRYMELLDIKGGERRSKAAKLWPEHKNACSACERPLPINEGAFCSKCFKYLMVGEWVSQPDPPRRQTKMKEDGSVELDFEC